MINLSECKIYETEEEALRAMVEKFVEDTMSLVEIAERHAFVSILTNIPLIKLKE